MIIHNVEQGTDEWHSLRIGIPTASQFDSLVTSKGEPSKQIEGIINEKVANVIAGKVLESWDGNKWTERGHELEPLASTHYEFIYDDRKVETVGFVTNAEKTCGCSPDRLVNDDGLLEIKCPMPKTHIDYLIAGKLPTTYFQQVQGQLMITGRRWCDFMSYHPDLPELIVRVERDDEFIEKLKARIDYFNAEVKKRVEIITNR
jgi:putative phage-type endonuclease